MILVQNEKELQHTSGGKWTDYVRSTLAPRLVVNATTGETIARVDGHDWPDEGYRVTDKGVSAIKHTPVKDWKDDDSERINREFQRNRHES